MRILHTLALIGAAIALATGQTRASESETLGAYLLRYEEERKTPFVEDCISKEPRRKAVLTGANRRYQKSVRKASADYLTLISTNPELTKPVSSEALAADQQQNAQMLADMQKFGASRECEMVALLFDMTSIEQIRQRLKKAFSSYETTDTRTKKSHK